MNRELCGQYPIIEKPKRNSQFDRPYDVMQRTIVFNIIFKISPKYV